MNNLHRELAPISARPGRESRRRRRRTFTRQLAGRRVVDLIGPAGRTLAAVGTGHLHELESPARACSPAAARSQPLVEFRVPFVVEPAGGRRRRARGEGLGLAAGQGRRQADRLRRGPRIFDGFAAAGIAGHPRRRARTRR